ncbi:hypothetical protein EJ08DRAFT_660722 [Tothia fuscella]|uniref:Uncharacterized protein n=1 Tax=Tothia fuscella TaxID=1048955 RepID=A0A9P4TYP5_9PEZI|nr:hypothetical protein EJ08DRAFT_660722 [Tothia fuscella]
MLSCDADHEKIYHDCLPHKWACSNATNEDIMTYACSGAPYMARIIGKAERQLSLWYLSDTGDNGSAMEVIVRWGTLLRNAQSNLMSTAEREAMMELIKKRLDEEQEEQRPKRELRETLLECIKLQLDQGADKQRLEQDSWQIPLPNTKEQHNTANEKQSGNLGQAPRSRPSKTKRGRQLEFRELLLRRIKDRLDKDAESQRLQQEQQDILRTLNACVDECDSKSAGKDHDHGYDALSKVGPKTHQRLHDKKEKEMAVDIGSDPEIPLELEMEWLFDAIATRGSFNITKERKEYLDEHLLRLKAKEKVDEMLGEGG